MPDQFPSELDHFLAPPAPGAEAAVVQADPMVEGARAVLNAKYAVQLAYMAYGDQLRTSERDGLYKHFQEHMEDERGWIYQLHRLLAARGEANYPSGVTVPQAPLAAPRPMLEALLGLERTALAAWEQLAGAPGVQDSLAYSGFAQEGAHIQMTHIEDLQRWLGGGG